MQSCLLPDEQGVKRLLLRNCDRLRGYISQVSVRDGTKNSAADQPAVAALGHAIHTLFSLEPWRECLDAEESYWDE